MNKQYDHLRFAQIGVLTSWTHVTDIIAHPHAELVAVAEPDQGLLSARRSLTTIGKGDSSGQIREIPFHFPESVHFYADYRRMLDEVRPDVVALSTPNSLHYEITEECARRGVHVWMLKPLTVSGQRSRQLAAITQRAGIRVFVNVWTLWTRFFQTAFQRLKAGDIGAIQSVFWENGHSGLQPDNAYGAYYNDPARHLGGFFVDQGTYSLAALTWLLGKPQGVFAVMKKLRDVPYYDHEDEIWLTLNYPGTTAVIHSAASLPYFGERRYTKWVFTGNRGMLYNQAYPHQPDRLDVFLRRAWTEPYASGAARGDHINLPEVVEPVNPPPERTNGMLHFINCMLHDKPFDWPHTIEAAIMVDELTDAAYESARSGKMVTLD